MNLRFSRSSLNLIIFTCIILIGWASIDKNRSLEAVDDQDFQQEIELPKLADFQYDSWTSLEGIDVFWQSRLDTDFKIRIRGSRAIGAIKTINSDLINWQPNFWQWDINLGPDLEQGLSRLNEHLKTFPDTLKQNSATVILQGPWSNRIAKLSAASIIKKLQLQPINDIPNTSELITSTDKICPWQPVSAQFWLQDQLSNQNLSQPNIQQKIWQLSQWSKLPPISPHTLHAWKQTFVQQWQLNWQKPAMQFDMLTDLAYYRLPQNYLLQGYWGINTLDVKQLNMYLSQCQTPNNKALEEEQ